MAPPFILEPYIPAYDKLRSTKVTFSKNKYNDKVKVHDWQHSNPAKSRRPEEDLGPLRSIEERPARSEECICDTYKTSYETMTDQRHLKSNYVNPYPRKHLFNYFGYRDDMINPTNFNARRDFPTIMKNDHNMVPQFITTMQSSYASPLGLIMQRLRSPEERFMLHRRMKGSENSSVNTKFRDDRVEEVNRSLQCARKGHYGISYNPMTCFNNDGSVPKVLSMKEDGRITMELKRLE